MKDKRTKIILFLVGNIIFIISACIYYLFSIRNLPEIDHDRINTSTWRGLNVDYRDGGSFVNDEIKGTGLKTDFLWGPYAPLKKGSYTAVIHYTAEENQSCYAGDPAWGGESQHYRSSHDVLSKYRNSANYNFEITEDVEEFQLVIEYGGWGEFGIYSISLSPNNNRAKRILTETAALLLLVDFFIYFIGAEVEKRRKIFALVSIVGLVSLPLLIHGIYLGHDLEVHLLRIESVADALRSGQFPARISTLALWGLGYPFSIYYNDLYLYFPAILRLLGFSVNTSYKAYVFGVNLLTVLIAYESFRRIFKSEKIGLFLSLLYASASYRFVDVSVRAAVGEYTAIAFLPLIALALYRIYLQSETFNFKNMLRNALLFALGISGVLGAHILTLVMTGFLLLIVGIVLWRKTFRKITILTFLTAMIIIVITNLYFLVPFIDYYINIPVFIQNTLGGRAQLIQESGVFPGQLFAFFQYIVGNVDDLVEGRFQSTPGLVLMAVFLYAVYLRFFRKCNKHFRFLLFFSAFTLLLSLDIFPWNWLVLHSGLFKMLAQIQFPWRFLVFSTLFLTLLGGEILQEGLFSTVFSVRYAAAAAVLMSILYTCQLYNGGSSVFFYDTLSIDPERTGHEYLISNTKWEDYDPTFKMTNLEAVEVLSRKSNQLVFYCRASEEDVVHQLVVPVFNYKGYHVITDSGEELRIENSPQNQIRISLRNGFDGNIRVLFQDPLYWTVSLWVSLGCCTLIVICLLTARKKAVRIF